LRGGWVFRYLSGTGDVAKEVGECGVGEGKWVLVGVGVWGVRGVDEGQLLECVGESLVG